MRKGREPKINTSTANCFYYCWCSTIEKSTKRADLQRLPHVRAKSLNMLAFRMHTICYARLITKTEAYLTGTALIKQLLLVSGISAVDVMAHTEKKNTPHPRRHQQATTTSVTFRLWPHTEEITVLQLIGLSSHSSQSHSISCACFLTVICAFRNIP